MEMAGLNTAFLDEIIVGRVDPHIYAFTTETVPNYLKVGDTYRPVLVRIKEWSKKYKNLKHIYTESARIDENTIFRDYSVHDFLENKKFRRRLKREDIPASKHFSNEFFEGATTEDVNEAIEDIRESAKKNDGRYQLYTPAHLPITPEYTRGKPLTPRDNQQKVVDNFVAAYKKGRKNLLMFAVMRFGKSYTSMCCAKSMDAKTVLVVSAKADVTDEWKKTVQSIGDFEGYIFAWKKDLLSGKEFLQQKLNEGNKVVLFLTLQDLQGKDMKECHQQVFDIDWDLLIVDETHFGARAEHYGKVLERKSSLTKAQINAESERQLKDVDTLDNLEKGIKEIRRDVTLHLSGTPYRILMGDEFQEEDIIAFVQYSDIAEAQQKWIEDHQYDEEKFVEWENPYYGFPQMIRFAFNPNQASLDKIAELRAKGATTSFAELFRPKSMSASTNDYKKFVHEDVVLDFLKVIDGAKNDSNVLGFLDNERIKKGKLCHHIVMVLPYCASCDAMEELIKTHKEAFRNLSDYEIVNISGLKRSKAFEKTENVKQYISECESKGKKTITLTVNRMLTGNTVPEWDTMIFLKQCSSPEEYDQAIFRLQNTFIKEYEDADNEIIKINMKPQTILVDFDPERIFRLQERKSQIYNINTDNNGNSRLRDRIKTELRISPIITLDHNKLREVTVNNIMDAVRNYAATRSVLEEATEMPVDLSLLDNTELRKVIDSLNRIDANKGLSIPANKANKDGETDLDPNIAGQMISGGSLQPAGNNDEPSTEKETVDDIAKKFASYYALILFFAFLTDDRVVSLEDIIRVIDASENNIRISENLGLKKEILQIIQNNSKGYFLNTIDYKIQNTNDLNHDVEKEPLERVKTALTKFGRMSESEIVTPINVADEMVQLLPDDVFSHGPALDIASKQGEFTIALLNRFGPEVSDKIYSVCTSKLAYEFTRKVYSLLSLPIDHIFDSFTSYDLIKKDKKGNFIIPQILKDMNFATILGNPPYQVISEKTSDAPIYHLFMDVAYEISKIVTLITPARYIFNVGKTPSYWNKERLQDPHFKIAKYTAKSADVFPIADIKGGVAVSLRNEYESYGPIRAYAAYPELNSILAKVSMVSKNSICEIIYPQNKFNLSELFRLYPGIEEKIGSNGREKRLTTSIFMLNEVFSEVQSSKSQIKILGLVDNKRTWRWVSKDLLESHPNTNLWKVILPKSNGSGAIGEVMNTPLIGEPLIGEPNVGVTQSFITFGTFDSENQAQACLKYLKTRFARTLLGILKVTQDNSKETWKHVPMQDFTENSDIDWSKSVEEIDKKLYSTYHLSDEEIAFIESKIKPM